MTSFAVKAARVLLPFLILLVVGADLGRWLAARYYQPLLNAANINLANTKAARDNLEALAGEQGKALGDLTLAAQARQDRAEQAVAEVQAGAQADYVAANRLQQERTGGDQCAAATSIIDKELGL